MAARPLRSLCYVSLDFDAELAVTKWKGKKNLLRREFVMPDYVTHFRGQIRDPNVKPPPSAGADSTAAPPKKKEKKAGDEEQVLTVANERIAVPEVLFAPNSIGIDQAGVAETIVQSVEGCLPDMQVRSPPDLHPMSTRSPTFSHLLSPACPRCSMRSTATSS